MSETPLPDGNARPQPHATAADLSPNGWLRRVTIPSIVGAVVIPAITIPGMWTDPQMAASPTIGKLVMAAIIGVGGVLIGGVVHMVAKDLLGERPLDEIGNSLAPSYSTDSGVARLFDVKRSEIWRWRRHGVPEDRRPAVLEALDLSRTMKAAHVQVHGAVGPATIGEMRERFGGALQ